MLAAERRTLEPRAGTGGAMAEGLRYGALIKNNGEQRI